MPMVECSATVSYTHLPEHILCYHHIKLSGITDQLHGTVIHQHILIRDVGILPGQPVHDGAPQAGGLQYVGLVYRLSLIHI